MKGQIEKSPSKYLGITEKADVLVKKKKMYCREEKSQKQI